MRSFRAAVLMSLISIGAGGVSDSFVGAGDVFGESGVASSTGAMASMEVDSTTSAGVPKSGVTESGTGAENSGIGGFGAGMDSGAGDGAGAIGSGIMVAISSTAGACTGATGSGAATVSAKTGSVSVDLVISLIAFCRSSSTI